MAVVASLMTCLVHYVLGFTWGRSRVRPVYYSDHFEFLFWRARTRTPGNGGERGICDLLFHPALSSRSPSNRSIISYSGSLLIVSGILISVLTGLLRRSSQVIEFEGTEEEGAGSVERAIQTGFAVALAILGIVGIVAYFGVVQLTKDAAIGCSHR